ncbi:MAG: hypothetical protein DRI90_07480 [Deltaproteobacteria bacterium]|nr:MAG: hypothetical protein DRI90_07480 [Deltaproteobacteria bacterium]
MFRKLWLAVLAAVVVGGCDVPVTRRDEPRSREPVTDFSAAPGYDPNWAAARSARTGGPLPPSTRPATKRSPVIDDPLRGRWSLKQATATLPAGQQLVATIGTSMGQLSCELWPDKAPNNVALFMGLANGQRPYRTGRGWLRLPAYDGSHVDRVSPGLMIQLGPLRDVAPKGLGLTAAPEPWPKMRLDQPGLLCLRSQSHPQAELTLLITDGSAKNLAEAPDGGPGRPSLTVLGRCRPLELIHRIASVPAANGRPLQQITIEQLRVSRPPTQK